jgi:alkanesulfonate monooxygenase SsuD/methylene tetrahydromethanopterin reductase-like flavin-dependent oxidoreductase (luciferase family)
VLAGHCREVGRDPSEIVRTRLGPIVVSADRAVVERRVAALKAARGLDDDGLAKNVVWGDPDQVAEGVQRLLDAGLDSLIFNMPTGSTPEDVALAGTILRERFG